MTTTEPIVSLRDVGKRYVKYEDTPTLIQGVMRRGRGKRRSQLWAVRHVNLEVQAGESVGVIGRNGAGKSTMLAMLAGVTAPTEGVVAVRGRVAPLLKLGVGFHEELTGRENIYINGTILGMSEQEIDGAFDDIVGFAELEEFIDTPVKFYSSGMQARLGFSVAVSSNPDVLIVDEVLAVGDAMFQSRSFDRMLELQSLGTTILVVSHNLDSIRRVCSRVLVMNKGVPYFEGPADEGINTYHELLRVSWDEVARNVDDEGVIGDQPDAPIEILGIELLNEEGKASATFKSKTMMTIRLHFRVRKAVTHPIAGFWLSNQANILVYRGGSVGLESGDFEAGEQGQFDIRMGLHLANGTYTLGCWMGWGETNIEHVRAPAQAFYVSSTHRRGVCDLGAEYEARRVDPAASTPTDSPAAASDPRAL
ncbi:MAG: ABC transporter ATP-binding protein [Actinomycetota bacterium]